MFEIEIKAHVKNREKVIEELNSFAEYQCFLDKEDTYYRISGKDGKTLSFRIRKETVKRGNKEGTETFFTYKKKTIQTDEKGNQIEVNNENECLVPDPSAIITFAIDLGAEVSLKKRKITEAWHLETEVGTANIELCTVPPLGDFLEIEIVSDRAGKDYVEQIRHIEENILEKCGISLSEIEPRYYKDLLNEVNEIK